jgi:hypothetical protein
VVDEEKERWQAAGGLEPIDMRVAIERREQGPSQAAEKPLILG